MSRMPAGRAGIPLGLLSAATFGTSGTFASALIATGWSATAAVTVRIGVAAAVLLVPALWSLRGRWGALRSGAGVLAGYGLLAVAASQVCYFNAVRYLPVGVALLLEYLGIVLIVLWTWIVHGQRPRRLTIAGSVVAIVGLVGVLDLTGHQRTSVAGVLWGLGAAVGLAMYYVLSARAGDGLPAIGLAGLGMLLGAVALGALGLVGALPMHASRHPVTLGGHSMSWLVPIAGLALVAAVVSYVSGIAAARRLGARFSSFLGLFEVVFAVLWAWLFLGQLPAPIQFAGGALIIAGVVLVRAGEPADAPAPATEADPVPVLAGGVSPSAR